LGRGHVARAASPYTLHGAVHFPQSCLFGCAISNALTWQTTGTLQKHYRKLMNHQNACGPLRCITVQVAHAVVDCTYTEPHYNNGGTSQKHYEKLAYQCNTCGSLRCTVVHCSALQCQQHTPWQSALHTHGSTRTPSTSPIIRLIHKSPYSNPIVRHLPLPAVCTPQKCRLQTSYSAQLPRFPIRAAKFCAYVA